MDAKSMGKTIAALRKKQNLTQKELALKLKISDKAVSKWESGLGFPEITLLPEISTLFGVSVDYLMTGERKGIVIAGNILTDVCKNIDTYPKIGMLANISSVKRAVGGCVPNTGIDLATIDKSIPISAVGKVGDDEYGRYVTERMRNVGINTDMVRISSSAPTSFSDVMNLPSGERTFFHARGANAEFSPADVDISSINAYMLHIGYILLLDKFDEFDEEYGTVMARFLHDVQEKGIKTSIDVVSSSTADYQKTIVPALKYCDYAVMNEIESTSIWGLNPRKEDGKLNIENIKEAMRKILDAGVKEKVIVHSKEAGFLMDKNYNYTAVASLDIPRSEIKGSVGAGDAYCAGCLYGIYHNLPDKEILEFACSAASFNLFAEDSVSGMRSREEILKLPEKYAREIHDLY